MKSRCIFFTVLILALGVAGTVKVSAQFSMNSTVQDTGRPSAPMPMLSGPIKVHVINDAEAEVRRKELWRQRNDVDFKVSLQGIITQFNKSWVKDNQNAISSDIVAYYYHTYTKDRFSFTFKFDGKYGMNFIDDKWFKNTDELKIYNLAGWAIKKSGAFKNWRYSISGEFKSQFSEGFKSREENDVVWSNFMAPGTINAGIGFTYASPGKKLPFVVTIEPASGNALFVLDDRLNDDRRKNLGIPVPRKEDGSLIKHKIEGGSKLNVSFNRTFVFGKKDGFTMQYNTTLGSFYGWMTQIARHEPVGTADAPKAIMPTVNWVNTLTFNPVRFLTLDFSTTTLYDRSQVDKVQMRYYLRIGLTYRYKNR